MSESALIDALPPKSLRSQNSSDYSVAYSHFNNQIAASGVNVIPRAIGYSPANFLGAGLFGSGHKAILYFDTFLPSPVISSRYRSRHGKSEFVSQHSIIQTLWHFQNRLFRRQHFCGLPEHMHSAVWSNKIEEDLGNHKLSRIVRILQVWIIAHRALVGFARLLHVIRCRVGMRVKGRDDLSITNSASRMRRNFDACSSASRPSNDFHGSLRVPQDKPPSSCRSQRPGRDWSHASLNAARTLASRNMSLIPGIWDHP
jgi:hypothetical protein